ncbi:MAG: ABC transporter substrate-binding protein [Pseudolabrys sp.]|nr:ABC transporter substrate-binding protein [Pseudolabrys sp.]
MRPLTARLARTRRAALLLAAFVAALSLGAATQVNSQGSLRLIVTHTAPPLVPNSVMDLADSLGFYRREGLKVEIVHVQSTPLAIIALNLAYGDLANVSLSGAIQAAAQRAMKLRAIMSPDKTIPFLIASRQQVPSLKALEGLSLGIGGIGSLDYSMSRLVLRSLGVDAEKVRMVAVGEPHVRALSLSTGRIDATTMSTGVWNRFRSRPELKVLLSAEDYFRAAPALNKVIAVDEATLAAKRPAIERFITAIIKASRAFEAEPGVWVDAMAAARPDVPREELADLALSFRHNWSVNGGLDPARVGYSIEQHYREPDFQNMRRISIDEFLDIEPTAAVLARIGIIPGHDPNAP